MYIYIYIYLYIYIGMRYIYIYGCVYKTCRTNKIKRKKGRTCSAACAICAQRGDPRSWSSVGSRCCASPSSARSLASSTCVPRRGSNSDGFPLSTAKTACLLRLRSVIRLREERGLEGVG